ncbi:hypothetical protein BD410DRAFT_595922 [Rickenella mellea]|uniref:Serine-threonine/tyrosine-protein kinase catalytic domain-containing protein n=1 Tax=Rickenella mellea TaxID=50990 RepID=A0A4Y7QE86_9AGAM|nr:hypothetical protein BD410DRAFT_595922 [Rickenella mellea]
MVMKQISKTTCACTNFLRQTLPGPHNARQRDAVFQRLAPRVPQWRSINHPNVARFLGLWDMPSGLAVVTANYENGDILAYVNTQRDVDPLPLVCD